MGGYLTEEYLQLQQMARRFTEQEIIPIADQIDEQEAEIPEEILKKMGELGFFGIMFPEEYGGAGLDALAVAVVTEELSRGMLSVGSVAARNLITGLELVKYGTEDQKKRFLPGMATGELQTATAGTEPEAGSDAANIKTTAKKVGNKYILNGSKVFTTFANRANVLFVYARTDPEAKPKHRGISCFMIEKEPGEQFAPPHLTGSRIKTIGYHGMNTYTLFLENLEVPEENLLGGVEGKGFYQLMSGYEIARIQFAFRSIGVARAAYEKALQYAQERVQFDQPIAKFQAIRFRLAEMATEIEAARQLGYYAADKHRRGERCDLEAGMAKLLASEIALKHAWGALQMHGGYGYTREYPVQRYWRDAGLLPIGEGTTEIQKEIIARRLLGE